MQQSCYNVIVNVILMNFVGTQAEHGFKALAACCPMHHITTIVDHVYSKQSLITWSRSTVLREAFGIRLAGVGE